LAGKIKDKIIESTSTKFNSDDTLGSDFDDPEAHTQETDLIKIKTGWDSMDTILGGGWDISTFNVIMGTTNSGKCFFGSGIIYIRHKKNNKIEKIKIENFFAKIKSKNG